MEVRKGAEGGGSGREIGEEGASRKKTRGGKKGRKGGGALLSFELLKMWSLKSLR